ncbi:MAG: peptidylprolyl isomerase [Oscillospiraceae bacterium]|nr:peptidylprolyl isomerase [Oscillospiraceae bacterium]
MQCKNCGASLEPEMECCPECGMAVREEKTEASSGKGIKAAKIVLAVVAVAALLCIMVLVVFQDVLIPGHWFSTLPGTIPEDGYKGNVTCQGTYTDSVLALKWKKDTVVAKIGDMTLTNGQLQVFYDMAKSSFVQSNSNLSSLNLDLSQPLDRQICGLDESLTWQQYFLQKALEEWKLYAVLCQQAAQAGYKLSDEDRNSLDDLYNQFYKNYVATGKFSSVDAALQDRAGLGCDFGDYLTCSEWQMIASMYFNKRIGEYEATEEQIDAYYQEFQEQLEKNNIKKDDGNILVDVRHILIAVKDPADQEAQVEESDWQACQKKAQDVLDAWLAGEATEESFAKLAEEYSSDSGSNTNGGLYTGVQKGEMLDTFDAWCFDGSRKVGDYGLVKTVHGYHVMYFAGSEEYWHAVCKAEVPYWQVDQQLNAELEALDAQIYFEKMSLWEFAYSK